MAKIFDYAPDLSPRQENLPQFQRLSNWHLMLSDSWWEKDVFQGKPDFNKLHGLQKFILSQEEQDFLANETNQLCALINDWEAT